MHLLNRFPSVARTLWVVWILAAWPTALLAGGGPENVFLVVNPRSQASLAVANHYVQLRRIPACNLFFLPWDPKAEYTEVDSFRRQILMPILKTIKDRGLADQIDYVVYSSDFPWGIRLKSDLTRLAKELTQMSAAEKPPKEQPGDKPNGQPPPAKLPKYITPVGSLNGMTYLWQTVMVGSPEYLGMRTNRYYRRPIPEQRDAPSAGFHAGRRYDKNGKPVARRGRQYMLSTMLGVTAGRGNSVSEVVAYLERSAKADATRPKGTIYFLQNDDVRSKARHAGFPKAVRELKQLGVHAEILQGAVPRGKPDVQGAVLGTAGFDWKATGSTILPGAICEHFTSFGGVMSANAGQTPLSEFLRYGAAGASGTVVEPYAIPEKFPSPMVQVHYARGCTLAEAFYQSVAGPYQLLIVGDPLCRPWAVVPKVSVSGVEPGATVRGVITLRPTALSAENASARRFELFVDGSRWAVCKPGESFSIDTSWLADGYHEIRMVAIGPAPIETQGRQFIPISVANHGRKIDVSLAPDSPLRADQPVGIVVHSPGAKGVVVIRGVEVIGHIAGEKGQIDIPAGLLGPGPISLRVAGLGGGGPSSCVMAPPLEFTLK